MWHVRGRVKKHRILGRKPDGKRPFRRPRGRCGCIKIK
jgi:hypothetical protein